MLSDSIGILLLPKPTVHVGAKVIKGLLLSLRPSIVVSTLHIVGLCTWHDAFWGIVFVHID